MRGREPRTKDSKYMGIVARLPSVISGREGVHVAHVRFGDIERGKRHTGMGEKPSDCWVLPLTPDEHMWSVRSQHANNEKEWWDGHGIDPIAVCIDMYAAFKKARSPLEAEEAMRKIALTARSR